MSGIPASQQTEEIPEAPSTPAVARTSTRARRFRRRSIECLRCGTARRVGATEGECPSCGYLGWKPGQRRLSLVPITGR